MIHKGKVKWFNKDRGWGFVVDLKTKEEIVVPFSAVQAAGLNNLQENSIISYNIILSKGNKKAAKNIKLESI